MANIKRYYEIPASPEDVYRALVYAPTIQLWTGEPAIMNEEPGSEFSLWGDSICGRNIAFEPGRKLVQQWYFGDYAPSVVTIILHPHKKGTSVELRHTEIPDEDFENISDGWDRTYFAALIDFYSS